MRVINLASGETCGAATGNEPRVTRRSLLELGTTLSLAALAHPAAARSMAGPHDDRRDGLRDWECFRERFIAPEGRVVDSGNQGISHSEGQGVGMLAAAQFNDRVTFDRLSSWTRRTLRRSSDHLHSWRYRPEAEIPVDDPNNATDGDLLIAFALLRGADRWDDPTLRAEGRTRSRATSFACSQ